MYTQNQLFLTAVQEEGADPFDINYKHTHKIQFSKEAKTPLSRKTKRQIVGQGLIKEEWEMSCCFDLIDHFSLQARRGWHASLPPLLPLPPLLSALLIPAPQHWLIFHPTATLRPTDRMRHWSRRKYVKHNEMYACLCSVSVCTQRVVLGMQEVFKLIYFFFGFSLGNLRH